MKVKVLDSHRENHGSPEILAWLEPLLLAGLISLLQRLARTEKLRSRIAVTGIFGLALVAGLVRFRLVRFAVETGEHERQTAAQLIGLSETFAIEHSQLESLFGKSPAIINVLRGSNHVFELTHPVTRELLGGRDVTGLPVREAIPELKDQGAIRVLDEVYRSGRPYHATEAVLKLNTVDGNLREVFFNISLQPWRDHRGRIAGIMVFGVDVTEQVQARRRAEDALRARDEFITIASHELRTPLTSLKLQTQLVKRRLSREDTAQFSTEQVRHLVESEDRQVDRLTRLVEDMLEITRLNTGKVQMRREAFDLGSVVRDVIDRFAPQAESAIELKVDQPVHGFWDRYRVEQVVINLISNAIKYGGAKPVLVTVSGNGKATIVVRDQGIGIAKEHHTRIFQRFERAVSASNISGFGLGLYITREILAAHGGSIQVESELGRGSTFTVQLPLPKEQAQAA